MDINGKFVVFKAMVPSKKRKVDKHFRVFNEKWRGEYFIEVNGQYV